MSRHEWLPDADQIASFHEELTELFSTEEDPIAPPGIKDRGLLESAAHRPYTRIGNNDKYQSILLKSAALFHSVAKNHAFHNGNKRTAIVTLLTTLYRNDICFRQGVNDDHIYDLAVRVADDRFPTDAKPAEGDALISILAEWIDENSENFRQPTKSMRTSAFIRKCEEAGCTVKKSKNGTWIIQNHGIGSVNIAGSTKEISGNVVRRFLRSLGLTTSRSGILEEEFRQGVTGERQEMHRYMAALRRLAKT